MAALGLPKGSIRAMIVLYLLGLTTYLSIKGLATPEWLVTLVTAAVMFYFGSRKSDLQGS